jgi:WXG100 protein secretion system (Wss), protein YukD
MTTLVVTVAWRGRRHDFAVPADVPVADLLLPLAAALATWPAQAAHDPAASAPRPGWSAGGPAHDATCQDQVPIDERAGTALALAPLGGQPLPPHRTLAASGVGDGAVLVLLDHRSPGPAVGARPDPTSDPASARLSAG